MPEEIREVHHHEERSGNSGMWIAGAIALVALIAVIALLAGGAFQRQGSNVNVDANVPPPSDSGGSASP